MGKREFEKLKPMKASTQMIKACLADVPVKRNIYRKGSVWTHKYYKFYDAAVENGILKVGIWQRCFLRAPGQRPDFTIYIDRKTGKWMTYSSDGWSKAKIINLNFADQEGEIFGSWNWNSTHALKIVTEYLDMPAATIQEAVRKYQTKGNSAGQKYYRNELCEIDEFMEAVPELPKGFNNDWLIKAAFKSITSLMYHPGRKVTEAYCTRCQTTVQITDKPKHLKKTKCPHCRAEATYRSWNKQQTFDGTKSVGILQKLKGRNDEYCLTRYNIRLIYRKENGYKEPEIRQGRVERFWLMPGSTRFNAYEMDEYKTTGVYRWCKAGTHGMGYSYYCAEPYCVLYEKNIDRILKDTDIKYIPARKILGGKSLYINDALYLLDNYHDAIEKIVKAGMSNLTDEIMQSHYGMRDEVNTNGRRLNEILRLDRKNTRLAVEMDCNIRELEVLQAAQAAKMSVDEELVREVTKYTRYKSQDDICLFLQRKNLRKMLSYLNKLQQEADVSPEYAIRDYEDYLEQLARLRIPADKHNRFPANFYHVHDELAKQIREEEAKVEQAKTRQKNEILRKVIKDIKKDYEVKSNSFIIVWPQSKADFTKEGQLQHNCVGGYFDRCAKNETTVFFLRKKEEPEKPFCTVEFKNGKLIQCRTKFNNDAPEEAMKYMEKIEKYYEKQQRTKETM